MGEVDKDKIVFKNRRVEVSLSRTINTGDFNSERVHGGFSGDIEDTVDLMEAYNVAYIEIEKAIQNEIRDLGL